MFSPYCYPPAGSEAIVTSKLLLAMLDSGWDVDVISQSNFGHYYPFSQNEVWNPVKKIVYNISAFENRVFLKRFGSLSYLQSISWANKAIKVAQRLISGEKYDFILSRATPLYGHLPALIIANKTGIPWIANWSDPLPPQKAPPPYGLGPTAHIPIYIKKYCGAVAGKATWHTFPCERLRKYFCSYMPEITEKSSVIPHIALRKFCSNNKNISKGFSLCHIGSLGYRDPHVFLDGVRRFLQQENVKESFNIRFIGSEVLNLLQAVEKYNLTKIIDIENLKTYEETQKSMSQSNVLVVIEAPCEEGVFFPSKFVDYVQTGQPILALGPVIGTLSDILAVNRGGIPVDCRSSDDVSRGIEVLYTAWKAGTLNRNYGSSHLFEMFCENKVIGLYEEIFDKIQVISDQ